MRRDQEITELAKSIMDDISENRAPLHLTMLKASQLSRLLDQPEWTKWFVDNSKVVETCDFSVKSFSASIDAAKDHPVSVSSANPTQYLMTPVGNWNERARIKKSAEQSVQTLGEARSAVFTYASTIYAKWQFANTAESIFERKRTSAEQALKNIFKDSNERYNSIEQNLKSTNPEDWKNAMNSCRTLLMDLADALNPAKKSAEKPHYIDRLKDFISPKISSNSQRNLQIAYLEEMKNLLELVAKTTQGGAHQERPSKEMAETIVLHVYLIIANLMEIYSAGKKTSSERIEPPIGEIEQR